MQTYSAEGIDTKEIIATVHGRRAPMMSATAGLRPTAARAMARSGRSGTTARKERAWNGSDVSLVN